MASDGLYYNFVYCKNAKMCELSGDTLMGLGICMPYFLSVYSIS